MSVCLSCVFAFETSPAFALRYFWNIIWDGIWVEGFDSWIPQISLCSWDWASIQRAWIGVAFSSLSIFSDVFSAVVIGDVTVVPALCTVMVDASPVLARVEPVDYRKSASCSAAFLTTRLDIVWDACVRCKDWTCSRCLAHFCHPRIDRD